MSFVSDGWMSDHEVIEQLKEELCLADGLISLAEGEIKMLKIINNGLKKIIEDLEGTGWHAENGSTFKNPPEIKNAI